ncbi:esterase/lipase family protein [Desulfobacterium sp. N47]|uniref:esterase/lipase family protein n=1 Tax=Desulfobacterium sp. N47 TaxID=3115210 RepID=UPI003C9E8F58
MNKFMQHPLLLLPLYPVKDLSKAVECVILLHGLARTKKSLLKLERHLEKNGFCVVNTGFPSRKKTIQELSVDVIPEAIEKCFSFGATRIHFVTHSIGGILLRYYLAHNNKVPRLGRVVMLSPPNSGSEVVDKLRDICLFKWINGPAGEQLGTGPDSLPKSLGAVDYEVGIITGDKTINPLLSLLIPGENDGKVSVESAKLCGMKDFLVVHKTHPFIMNDKKVLCQITAFINNGIFNQD